MGTKGYIKLGPHCQCPTNITVISEEKAAQQHVDNGDLNAGIEYCIPDVHACRTGKTPEYVFVNSAGLQYSAAAIYRCIRSGLKECPQYTIEGMFFFLSSECIANCFSFFTIWVRPDITSSVVAGRPRSFTL